MDQDVALNVDDIKFLREQKLALRHVTKRDHLVRHTNPDGLLGDAYSLCDMQAQMEEEPGESPSAFDNRFKEKWKNEPEAFVDVFNSRLKHSIHSAVKHDIRTGDVAHDTKETHFLVLKDMQGATFSYDVKHGGYIGGFGKCGGQGIKPDQICNTFKFTPDEISNAKTYDQMGEIAYQTCVQQIKAMRNDFELGKKCEPGRNILAAAIAQIDHEAKNELKPEKSLMSYKAGDFETKLHEVTGIDFKNASPDLTVARIDQMTYAETSLPYRGELAFIAPCAVTVGKDHFEFHIDKNKVDMGKFESFYQWKKQDIAAGEQTAQQVSAETGLNLESKYGMVTLFDSNTRDFVTNANKNEKIVMLQKTMAENGYDYSMVMETPGIQAGLIFTRQQPTVSVAGGMR